MAATAGLLAEATKKNIYRTTRVMKLGDALDYPHDTFDGVVVAGVFTPGHASVDSFDELIRITKGDGYIIYTLRSDVTPPGFLERQVELEERGLWTLRHTSGPFQSLPHGEPEVHHRVWAYQTS